MAQFNANALRNIYRLAIPAAVGVSLASQSIYDVRGGSRAVIFDRLSGVKEGVISEGTHFLVPWLQKSIIFDVRTKPRMIATTTGSKDLQMVSLTLRVLHRPEVQALPKIYQVRPILSVSSRGKRPTANRLARASVKTTTSECCPRSATRSSSPSWPSSTPPS